MSELPTNPMQQSGGYVQPRYHAMSQQSGQSKGGRGYSIFVTIMLLLALAAIGGIIYLYYEKSREFREFIRNNEVQVQSLEEDMGTTAEIVVEMESQLASLRETYPLIVTALEVANVDYNSKIDTDYGRAIYSSSTMYLQPRITYSATESSSVTLYVKLYRVSGDTNTLCTGNSSPSGYSYKQDVTLSMGEDNTLTLMGWGGSSKGHWSSGTYRYEVWYNDICLKAKKFEIH